MFFLDENKKNHLALFVEVRTAGSIETYTILYI